MDQGPFQSRIQHILGAVKAKFGTHFTDEAFSERMPKCQMNPNEAFLRKCGGLEKA